VSVVSAHRTEVLDILTTRRDRDLSVAVPQEQQRRLDQGSAAQMASNVSMFRTLLVWWSLGDSNP
jgi:hypothetical protein